jgi:hypothetical protein
LDRPSLPIVASCHDNSLNPLHWTIMEWINIDEKKPIECESILLASELTQCVNIGIYMGGRFLDHLDKFRQFSSVSHWMRLPIPPRSHSTDVGSFIKFIVGKTFSEEEASEIINMIKTRMKFKPDSPTPQQ